MVLQVDVAGGVPLEQVGERQELGAVKDDGPLALQAAAASAAALPGGPPDDPATVPRRVRGLDPVKGHHAGRPPYLRGAARRAAGGGRMGAPRRGG